MNMVRTEVVEIGYLEQGDPKGTPVIFVHGFPDDAHTWDGVMRELGTEKLWMLSPFVRGYQPTRVMDQDALVGQVAALAQDVLDFAAALDVKRFLLVGQDWGARAGYAVAATHPDRLLGLVALATPYVMFGGERESTAQVKAYWYQWYFNTQQGEEGFVADPIGFCEYLWQAWSPEWTFSRTGGRLQSARIVRGAGALVYRGLRTDRTARSRPLHAA